MKAVNKLKQGPVNPWIAGLGQTDRQSTRHDTSDDANRKAEKAKTAMRILSYIEKRPSTCDEIMEALGISHQTASPSINHLMREGKIIPAGTRETRTGRKAKVWQYCDDPVPIVDLRPTRKQLEVKVQMLEQRIMQLEASR